MLITQRWNEYNFAFLTWMCQRRVEHSYVEVVENESTGQRLMNTPRLFGEYESFQQSKQQSVRKNPQSLQDVVNMDGPRPVFQPISDGMN